MEQKPFRSQRSINEEVAKAAAEKAEEDRLNRMNAVDALLDLALSNTITLDEVAYEVRALDGVREKEMS